MNDIMGLTPSHELRSKLGCIVGSNSERPAVADKPNFNCFQDITLTKPKNIIPEIIAAAGTVMTHAAIIVIK